MGHLPQLNPADLQHWSELNTRNRHPARTSVTMSVSDGVLERMLEDVLPDSFASECTRARAECATARAAVIAARSSSPPPAGRGRGGGRKRCQQRGRGRARGKAPATAPGNRGATQSPRRTRIHGKSTATVRTTAPASATDAEALRAPAPKVPRVQSRRRVGPAPPLPPQRQLHLTDVTRIVYRSSAGANWADDSAAGPAARAPSAPPSPTPPAAPVAPCVDGPPMLSSSPAPLDALSVAGPGGAVSPAVSVAAVRSSTSSPSSPSPVATPVAAPVDQSPLRLRPDGKITDSQGEELLERLDRLASHPAYASTDVCSLAWRDTVVRTGDTWFVIADDIYPESASVDVTMLEACLVMITGIDILTSTVEFYYLADTDIVETDQPLERLVQKKLACNDAVSTSEPSALITADDGTMRMIRADRDSDDEMPALEPSDDEGNRDVAAPCRDLFGGESCLDSDSDDDDTRMTDLFGGEHCLAPLLKSPTTAPRASRPAAGSTAAENPDEHADGNNDETAAENPDENAEENAYEADADATAAGATAAENPDENSEENNDETDADADDEDEADPHMANVSHLNPDDLGALITRICTIIENAFPPEDIQLLKNWIDARTRDASRSTTFATSCSGSDNVSDWIALMGEHLGVGAMLRQTFACDNDARCRSFIAHRHPKLPACFACASTLSKSRSINCLDPTLMPVALTAAGFFLFGFMCTDFSSRNTRCGHVIPRSQDDRVIAISQYQNDRASYMNPSVWCSGASPW